MFALFLSGGIQSSCLLRWPIFRTRTLLALSPGSITLPSSPPLSAPARLSKCSLPLALSPLWHFTQEFSKIGLMSAA
jgi:hypothetical protein